MRSQPRHCRPPTSRGRSAASSGSRRTSGSIMARVMAIDARGALRAHQRDRPTLRLSGAGHRCDPFLFRPRRLGAVRPRTQAHRRCDRDQAAVFARLRARGSGGGRNRAGTSAHFRHYRRRRHRRGNGRRDRGGGAANFAARLPSHRSANLAYRLDRGRSSPAAGVSRKHCRIMRSARWKAWASQSSSIEK